MEFLSIDTIHQSTDGVDVFLLFALFILWIEIYHTIDAKALSATNGSLRFDAAHQLLSDNDPHFMADINREYFLRNRNIVLLLLIL